MVHACTTASNAQANTMILRSARQLFPNDIPSLVPEVPHARKQHG